MKKFLSYPALAAIFAAASIIAAIPAGGAALAADPPEARCVYCGSLSYGDCGESPEKKHRHGANREHNKCVWCGLGKTAASLYTCHHGPGGRHEFY